MTVSIANDTSISSPARFRLIPQLEVLSSRLLHKPAKYTLGLALNVIVGT